MKLLLKLHDMARPFFEKGKKLAPFEPLFDAHDTFMFTPSTVTKDGTHVRDSVDLKRVMIFVVLALLPCTLFAMWNAGHQYNISNYGAPQAGFPNNLMFDFLRGAVIMLPIVATSYIVGGIWEVLFACVRRHEVNEGFLVTGLLFPLVLPPTIPLWQVAVGVSFGVVIGKEIFGGTGMNVLNPALTARAFLFFAYPAQMSGEVWTNIGHGNFLFDWFTNRPAPVAVDGFTGATPLAVTASIPEGTVNAVEALNQAGYTFWDMFWGVIPGSLAETCLPACLFGAAVLIISGVGSWRIMGSCVAGLFLGGFAANWLGQSPMSQLPPYYHLVMGGFAFGCVFMATDPVSAAATNTGKYIYGFLVGLLVVVIRVANPAYPEGVMLAILFMNVMAPMIDHYVVEAHLRRRAKAWATS